MKKEVAEQWVAALRSGKYEQGISQLKNARGQYCCLGVLCDISGLGVWEAGGAYRTGPDQFRYGYAVTPKDVATWAGLENPMGNRPGQPSLDCLNDDGIPFSEIADIIEKEWKTL